MKTFAELEKEFRAKNFNEGQKVIQSKAESLVSQLIDSGVLPQANFKIEWNKKD